MPSKCAIYFYDLAASKMSFFRVKAAIERKDETIAELQRDQDRLTEECQHLETLLERATKNRYLATTSATSTSASAAAASRLRK